MKLVNLKIELKELTPAEETEIEFALAAQLEDDFQLIDYKIEISDVCQLKTELNGDVLHEGTREECLMIMKSMMRYGIRIDKLTVTKKGE